LCLPECGYINDCSQTTGELNTDYCVCLFRRGKIIDLPLKNYLRGIENDFQINYGVGEIGLLCCEKKGGEKMPSKKYGNEIRLKAIELFAKGVGAGEIEKATGVPYQNIYRWADVYKKDPDNFKQFETWRKEKYKQFVSATWDFASNMTRVLQRRAKRTLEEEDAFDEIIEEVKAGNLSPSQKAVLLQKLFAIRGDDIAKISISVGTMIDKARLVNDESTENVSQRVSYEAALKEMNGKDF